MGYEPAVCFAFSPVVTVLTKMGVGGGLWTLAPTGKLVHFVNEVVTIQPM